MLFMKRPNNYSLKAHPKRGRSLVIIYRKSFVVFRIWSGLAVGCRFPQLCSWENHQPILSDLLVSISDICIIL